MRVVIYFILIFGFIISSFAQDIVVKQVWGNVQFVIGEQKIAVKNLTSFSEKSGVFLLKDKNSKLFIRIDDKFTYLTFSEDKHTFSLKELIAPKQDLEKKEVGFLDKFFTIFSVSHDDDAKIDGLLISAKSAATRGIFNDTNIILLDPIMMMDGYPIKIDFSNFIDSSDIENNEFNVLVKSNHKIILNEKTKKTYFLIDIDTRRSLSTLWDIEISDINSLKVIKGTVESLYIKSEQKKLFDELKDKAIAESETDESTYQIIFIESLRSTGLLANACYYLDLFIETNNNPILINYKDHYAK
jgi:hypothetical protein